MNKSTKTNQIKRLLSALRNDPATMLMLSVQTEILRANICRYIAQLQEEGKVIIHHKGYCQISKHKASYYQLVNKTGSEDGKV